MFMLELVFTFNHFAVNMLYEKFMNFCKKNLKISIWNINGYKCKGFNKFADQDFLDKLSSQDIFCLQETHCDQEQCLDIKEFPNPVHLIRPKNKKTGRRFGGLSIYIRNHVRAGVKFLTHASNDYIWLKLCKSYFKLHDDLYICFAYIPPGNSSFSKKLDYDILELIENDIVKYSQLGHILLAGDLNSRISQENDFIISDSDKHIPLYSDYKFDSVSLTMRRLNKNKIINTRGKQLLAMCISSHLRILNGRTFGDLLGSFTCHQPLGSSTEDYMFNSLSNIFQG